MSKFDNIPVELKGVVQIELVNQLRTKLHARYLRWLATPESRTLEGLSFENFLVMNLYIAYKHQNKNEDFS